MWVMSVLAKQNSPAEAIGEVIMRISREPDTARRVSALKHLFFLAGLRGLEEEVRERSRKVPIAADIMDHKVLGPALRKSREEGIQEGIRKGIHEGRQEGEVQLLRLLLERRFGKLPQQVADRLAACSSEEAESLALRVLDAKSLEDLFA